MQDLEHFLKDPVWDSPIFKKLANNDTGQALGHQAGMVLPKDLRKYFPQIDEGETSHKNPTSDRYLKTDLFVGTDFETSDTVRYQIQTWGGKRSAESRMTNGFQPLRDKAKEDDFIIIQRKLVDLNSFRFCLVKQTSVNYERINDLAKGRRWGNLLADDSPVEQSHFSEASEQINTLSQEPFVAIKEVITRHESKQIRVARSSVFREQVKREYDFKCAISGLDISTPSMMCEVESAHIVPVSRGGSDDIRNGIALAQTVHWAFDKGLLGITQDRKIYIPPKVRDSNKNEFIRNFRSKPIGEAKNGRNIAHSEAFKWHMDNVVSQWE